MQEHAVLKMVQKPDRNWINPGICFLNPSDVLQKTHKGSERKQDTHTCLPQKQTANGRKGKQEKDRQGESLEVWTFVNIITIQAYI